MQRQPFRVHLAPFCAQLGCRLGHRRSSGARFFLLQLQRTLTNTRVVRAQSIHVRTANGASVQCVLFFLYEYKEVETLTKTPSYMRRAPSPLHALDAPFDELECVCRRPLGCALTWRAQPAFSILEGRRPRCCCECRACKPTVTRARAPGGRENGTHSALLPTCVHLRLVKRCSSWRSSPERR